jgi:hypothetical protein
VQARFLRVADGVLADLWLCKGPSGGWCPGEIVAHLCQIERTVLSAADRIVRHQPRPVSFLKRIHVPLIFAERRLVRLKSPIPLDPALLAEKEAMLADLRNVRERTSAFVEETSSRDLSRYYWPHPFLGMLNTYSWLELIAAHQTRHTAQMRQFVRGLPKDVVSS